MTSSVWSTSTDCPAGDETGGLKRYRHFGARRYPGPQPRTAFLVRATDRTGPGQRRGDHEGLRS